jgi:thiamine-monophosphate kinase
LRDKIKDLGGIDVIGHITDAQTGAHLIMPDGSEAVLQAQGWRHV